jgi:hypothetical protein
MSLGLTDSQYYSDIADAIREKTGSAATLAPSEMSAAIGEITVGVNYKSFTYVGDGVEPNRHITFPTNNPNRIIYSVIGDDPNAHAFGDTTRATRWGETYMPIVSMPGTNRTVSYVNDGKTMSISGYPNNDYQILNHNGVVYTVTYTEL